MSKEHHRNRPYDILIVEDSANDVEAFPRTLKKVQVEMDMEINAHPVVDGVGAIARCVSTAVRREQLENPAGRHLSRSLVASMSLATFFRFLPANIRGTTCPWQSYCPCSSHAKLAAKFPLFYSDTAKRVVTRTELII
jgi:hypothetical protein